MAKGGKAVGKAAEGIIAKGVKDLLRVAAKDVEKDVAKDAAKTVEKDLGKDLAKTLEKDLGKDVEKGLEKDLGKDAEKSLGKDTSKSVDDRDLCGDPVDVATGEVVMREVDVDLAGVLPLELMRTHASSYRRGRCFGPSWSSTLDQRLEVDAAGVTFLADEAMILYYPRPDPGERVLPETGPQWPLTLDEEGFYTVTRPEHGHTLRFARLGEGGAEGIVRPLAMIVDRSGNRIEVDRDTEGVPALVRHSGGYHVAVDTDGGLITGLRLLDPETPEGIGLVRFGYDPDARLVEVVNSTGLPMRLTYDDQGRLTGWQDRNLGWYHYTYDEDGRCVRTTGKDGFLNAAFSYDPQRRVTVVTDSLGHATAFHLNERGRVVREVDPLGNATLSEWDDRGRLLSRTDPLGHTTRHTYDEAGNLIEAAQPDGGRSRAEYDAAGRPVLLTRPGGAVWRQEYDGRGNLVAVTDPAGATTRYAYDEAGRLTSITDALDRQQKVVTNGAGLVTSVTDPDGAVTWYERDVFGRVTTTTDPIGNTTRYAWTVEGALAWRVLPDGATERWTYDGEGNQVSYTDPLGQVTTTSIGPFDLPVAATGPDGRHSTFTYDTEMRLTAATNAAGQNWTYTYDPAGMLVAQTDVNGRTVSYQYDAAGRLAVRTDAGGQIVEILRDPAGNVVERRVGVAAVTGDAGEASEKDGVDGATDRAVIVTRFVRNAAGRVVRAAGPGVELTRSYDPAGRLLSETTNGRTITFGYDLLGRRTDRRTPSGVDSTWEYGPAHDLPVALHTAGQSVRFGYDAAGREVARRFGPDLLLLQNWDANSRLHAFTLTAGGLATAHPGRLLHRRAYTYRPDGYPVAVDDLRTGLHQYTLDTAGRITAVTAPSWSERYTYDAVDNVVAADWPTQAAGTADPTAGERSYTGTLVRGAGRTRYEYDSDGRLVVRAERTLSGSTRTWRYTWNADDQLTDVHTPDGQHWRYRYDPLGRRIAKERVGEDGSVLDQTVFCWDGTQLAEQTRTVVPRAVALSGTPLPGGNTTTWEYRQGTFEPLTQTDTIAGTGTSGPDDSPLPGTGGGTDPGRLDQDEVDRRFYAIVTDLVGAPTELVGPDGGLAWQQRRTIWGAGCAGFGTSGSTHCPLRFPGQYFDPESGLHYNFARHYDPTTAGYTAPDPLGRVAGPNPHGYVPNPTAWADPLGLAKKKCTKRVVYRQLNAEDRARFDAGEGLLPKGTSGDIAAHVRGDPTKHISASQLENQTERFASGNGLVEIDIDAAINGGARYVDHNNVMQAVGRAKDASTLKNWAERAGEVLFIDQIPFSAMKLVG